MRRGNLQVITHSENLAMKTSKETFTFKLLFRDTPNTRPIATIFLNDPKCNGSSQLISVTQSYPNATEMDEQIERIIFKLWTLRMKLRRQFASASLGSHHE